MPVPRTRGRWSNDYGMQNKNKPPPLIDLFLLKNVKNKSLMYAPPPTPSPPLHCALPIYTTTKPRSALKKKKLGDAAQAAAARALRLRKSAGEFQAATVHEAQALEVATREEAWLKAEAAAAKAAEEAAKAAAREEDMQRERERAAAEAQAAVARARAAEEAAGAAAAAAVEAAEAAKKVCECVLCPLCLLVCILYLSPRTAVSAIGLDVVRGGTRGV